MLKPLEGCCSVQAVRGKSRSDAHRRHQQVGERLHARHQSAISRAELNEVHGGVHSSVEGCHAAQPRHGSSHPVAAGPVLPGDAEGLARAQQPDEALQAASGDDETICSAQIVSCRSPRGCISTQRCQSLEVVRTAYSCVHASLTSLR